jgi:formylglycine-generating enzyme
MKMIRFRIFSAILVGVIGFAGATTAAETFKDCPDCPVMVKVPAGTFIMGSTAAETTREKVPDQNATWERPQHSVAIRGEFALGQYTVTRGEFAAFVRDSGYEPPSGCYVYITTTGQFILDQTRNWRNPGFPQTDRHPVVCVSFEDAQRYVQWLSQKTGKSYRLPTEAEWEYAARAGTTTARFWGDGRDLACDFANVADFTAAEAFKWKKANQEDVFQCRDGHVYTAPGWFVSLQCIWPFRHVGQCMAVGRGLFSRQL